MKLSSYPKIFQLGTKYIENIFDGQVEVTEKIDGSQFVFGKINGELLFRSKGAEIYIDNPNKMFEIGVKYIDSIKDTLPDNTIYYSEFLNKKKHNTLCYDRVPKNNIMLFAVSDTMENFRNPTDEDCELLGVERVPVLFNGVVQDRSMFDSLLETISILGGQKIEGVVVKNYNLPVMMGNIAIPLSSGKYVSESFKEVHNKRWSQEEKSKGKIQLYFDGFRTEARWNKAVQHLKERGELEESPRDIGKLMKEVNLDIIDEEEQNVKEFLWNVYKSDLTRNATRGLPEWYKKKLLDKSL